MTLLNSCVDLSFEQFDVIVVSFLVTCRKTLIVLLAVGATPLHELNKLYIKLTSSLAVNFLSWEQLRVSFKKRLWTSCKHFCPVFSRFTVQELKGVKESECG